MPDKLANDDFLIERYLQGEMSEDEAAGFEARFLSSSDLLDELESAEQLQRGLQDVALLQNASVPVKPSLTEKLSFHVQTLFRSPVYAMATSFLLLVSLGISSVLYQQNTRVNELFNGSAASTQIVAMDSVRGVPGADPVNILDLGQGHRHFALLLDPGYKSYSHFRVTVFHLGAGNDQTEILQTNNVRPTFNDMLVLGLPASILDSANYEVRLEGWQDEWPVSHDYELIKTISFTCITK